MKHNRIIAFVASALLVAGATALVAPRAFAQSAPVPSQQSRDDGGDQSGDREEGDSPWTDRGDGHDDPIPDGKPAITAAAAISAAQSYLKSADLVVGSLRLEKENGVLLYSVRIAGAEVKVDATTGKVVATDSGNQ